MNKLPKKTVFLLFALAIAIYLGIASVRLSHMCEFWDYYNYPKLKHGSQITFAELVLYATWLRRSPSYSWSSCLAELRLVEGSMQQWALDNGAADDDQATWDDLKPYLGYADTNHPPPCCPYGGGYILGKVGEGPRCPVRSHNWRQ